MNELMLDEQHNYWMGSVRIPGTSEIIGAVFPFNGRGLVAERARDFGIAVHKAIELKINGTLDEWTVDDSIRPYIEQAERFIIENGNATPKTEIKLYSKKYGFAGTLDLIIPALIVDFKTGMALPEHRLKSAAYRHLYNINFKNDKKEKSITVYLDGADKPPQIVEEQPADFGVFLCCFEIWKWKESLK